MRLKLTLAYVGTPFAGWQRQDNAPTVQAEVENAMARVAGGPRTVVGAGRTDAGVHATGQVAHADVDGAMDPADWLRAINAGLPATVRVVDCIAVGDDFHARYGARRKTYVYCIDEDAVASPFLAPVSWHVGCRLDLEAMRAAAAGLTGAIDQRTFATRPEGAERERPVDSVEIDRDRLLRITVQGRSFLRYAVRGMVGTLVEVGRGRRRAEGVHALARSGDRAAAAATAPPHGLCLAGIDYHTE